MFKEIKEIQSSADKVKIHGKPDVHMLLFISNGDGTGWNQQEWIDCQTAYAKQSKESKYIKLNCEHYVHDIEYELIAEKSKWFIEDVLSR